MKKITQEEVDKIIEKHGLWLKGESGGEKADFSNMDLQGMYLEYANLDSADLSESNLNFVYLSNANLRRANLHNAELYLTELSYTDLTGANLSGVNLYGANLTGAKLDEVTTDNNTKHFRPVCPEEGEFIGWKKGVFCQQPVLIKLLIPEEAKRSSATTNKCRASEARVLEMTIIKTGEMIETAYSHYQPDFEYTTDEYVYPDGYDEDRWHECSNGIHFFMTRQKAINY